MICRFKAPRKGSPAVSVSLYGCKLHRYLRGGEDRKWTYLKDYLCFITLKGSPADQIGGIKYKVLGSQQSGTVENSLQEDINMRWRKVASVPSTSEAHALHFTATPPTLNVFSK